MSSYNQNPSVYDNLSHQAEFGQSIAQHQGPTVVVLPVVTNTSGATTYRNYKSQQSIGFGITMIVVGLILIIFNIVAIIFEQDNYNYKYESGSGISGSGSNSNVKIESRVGYGFWGGIWLLITGPFGIYGGMSKRKCPIVAFLYLSITTAIAMLVTISLPVVVASQRNYNKSNYNVQYNKSSDEIVLAMNSMIAFLGLIGFIISFCGSGLACEVVCCCRESEQHVISSSPGECASGTVINLQGQQAQQQYAAYSGPYVGQGYSPPPMPLQQPIVYPGASYFSSQPWNKPYPTMENYGYDQEIISG